MKSNNLHIINLNLLSSRVLLLFVVLAASLYLGAAGYFLQIKQVGSQLFPLTTGLQPVHGTTVFFVLEQGVLRHASYQSSATGHEQLIPEPFKKSRLNSDASANAVQAVPEALPSKTAAAPAEPESAAAAEQQSLNHLLDTTRIIKEQIRRYTAMVGDDVLMATELSGKPAPYGSFEMPNQPFRPQGGHYSDTPDNNPIYNANVQNNPANSYDNGINQQFNGMPFSLGEVVDESIQGNSNAVTSQLQLNVRNFINGQLQPDKRN